MWVSSCDGLFGMKAFVVVIVTVMTWYGEMGELDRKIGRLNDWR